MAQDAAAVVRRFNRIPDAVKRAIEPALKREVDDLVAAQRRAAPVGNPAEGDDNPGKFRDSIHAYPNPKRPLSFRIIADAKDVKGHFIGSHIEYGHRTVNGQHVVASPSFWPIYRALRKPMRRRLNKVARDAVKAV
jgi:hypothetical protein